MERLASPDSSRGRDDRFRFRVPSKGKPCSDNLVSRADNRCLCHRSYCLDLRIKTAFESPVGPFSDGIRLAFGFRHSGVGN